MGRAIRCGLVGILESGSSIEAPGISALLLSKDPERLCSLLHPAIPTPDTCGGNQTPEGLWLAYTQFKLVATVKKQLGHFKYKSMLK